MSTLDHVVQLDNLLHELLAFDEIVLLQDRAGTLLQVSVARRWQVNPREEVIDDSFEERDVFGEELRHVDIHDAFQD